MAFVNLQKRVIQIVKNSGTEIEVVMGARSEDSPLPVISCHMVSAENFSVSLTDVFRISIEVKYEEHYADKSTTDINDEFSSILDRFTIDNLVEELRIGGQGIFNAEVQNVATDTQGEVIINQFILEIISERDP